MATRTALIVRGGWEGHSPVQTTDSVLPHLQASGFETVVSDSLDVYTDADLLARTDLVVHSWSMGTVTAEQLTGLRDAIAAGTGFAGWHGGIVDSFRGELPYLQLVGGAFTSHPGDFVDHVVQVVPDRADHPVVAGITEIPLTTENYWVLTDSYCDVLATTTVAARPGDPWSAPIVCPAVWTRDWGRGRVFVCTVGHALADLDVPDVRTIVERGLLWAAR